MDFHRRYVESPGLQVTSDYRVDELTKKASETLLWGEAIPHLYTPIS
jgi:hypothetical protein